VAESTNSSKSCAGRFTHWLLKERIEEPKGPGTKEEEPDQHSWWQVVCLTGVDYFSTLGYIPAALPGDRGAQPHSRRDLYTRRLQGRSYSPVRR
jgi:hypothetical protein